jgi:hypothetical protein
LLDLASDGDQLAAPLTNLAGWPGYSMRTARPWPRTLERDKLNSVTLAPPPKQYGVTHWNSQLPATHLGTGYDTVARVWREHGIQLCRAETIKFSSDPELVAKVTDVVGLYLDPRAPRGADVSSGGERPSPPNLSQQER